MEDVTGQPSKKFSRVSPGDEPPAKEPKDSGYETGCSWIFDSCHLSKFDFGYVYFQAVTLK